MLPINVKNGASGAIGTLASVCAAPAKAVSAGSNMAIDMAATLTGGAPMPKPNIGNPLNKFNLFSSSHADASLGQLPSPDAPDARGQGSRHR